MNDAGKFLVIAGLVLVALGLGVMLAGRTHLPLGRLPGDILYRGRQTTFYFPIVTCLLLSLLLTLVLWLFNRFGR